MPIIRFYDYELRYIIVMRCFRRFAVFFILDTARSPEPLYQAIVTFCSHVPRRIRRKTRNSLGISQT